MRGHQLCRVLHRVGELPIGSEGKVGDCEVGHRFKDLPHIVARSDGDVSFGHAVIGVEGHAQGIRVFGRRIILIA